MADSPSTPSTPEQTRFAPHPLGATLGPAAIKPRREGDPLLVAEIIRLLERHGVPWEQAVREGAGLMAQTVEEAEGWWAFEMAQRDDLTSEERIAQKRIASPAIPSDSGELERALNDYAQIAYTNGIYSGYADHKPIDIEPVRKRIEELFNRLQADFAQAEESRATNAALYERALAELSALRIEQEKNK